MEWWHALILGLVEGLTEYLPVSSTGHLVIVQHLLGLGEGPAVEAVNTFDIVVQAGAILAVLGLYRARVGTLVQGVLGKDPTGLRLLINLVVAFVPAAVVGLLLEDWIDEVLLKPAPITFSVIAGAAGIALFLRSPRGRHPGTEGVEALTPKTALLIGLAQCLALWPGTSRSLVTILAALLLGLSAGAAAEFSFLLGLVTLSAATGYKALKHGGEMVSVLGWANVGLGLVVATISAALAVKWFVGFLTQRGLGPFAVYRFTLGGALIGMIATGVL